MKLGVCLDRDHLAKSHPVRVRGLKQFRHP